ncbi:MAG: fibronectin type III domain-containing protein, partial [Patescibacteria group bacterium]
MTKIRKNFLSGKLKTLSFLLLMSIVCMGIYIPAQVEAVTVPTLLAHSKCGGSTCVAGAMNTTGATLLIAVVSEYAISPTAVAPIDTYGNTWRALTPKNAEINGNAVIYYSYDKAGGSLVTGASDVIRINGGSLAAMEVMAFSGTVTGSNPLDVQNGTACATCANPHLTGSVTPTQDNALIVSGFGANNTLNPPLVNSGFTLTDSVPYGSTIGGGAAYLVQTTAAAVNPAWQFQGGSTNGGYVIAAFKSADSTPPPADTTAPIISAVTSSSITQSGANITWTTDENSDTQVEYGTSISYGQSSALNSSLATSHAVSLASLSPATLYHYRVKSKDVSGNLGISTDQTFTTASAPAPDTTAPTTPGTPSVSVVSSSQLSLSWTA